MNLLSPWALLWLGAAGAILALYLLKPRSRRVEVSSTWLWQGVLKEESARSPMQWLKRHALLLLQLLVVLLGVFALARPAFRRDLPVGHTVVLAMDVSAAMLANDGDPAVAARASGGPGSGRAQGDSTGTITRLDEARARALQFLQQLRPGDQVIIMRMADHVEVVARGTLPGDLSALQTALRELQALPAELDLAHGLELAGGLAQSARLGEIIVFTGGVVDLDRVTQRPPVALQVARAGRGGADNQAITALAARRSLAGELEVFARVRNFGDQPVSGALRISVDGALYEEQEVSLPPQQSHELLLSEFPAQASLIEARFLRSDLLAVDNLAVAAVALPPQRKVLLVGARTDHLERALRAVPGVELSKVDPQRYDPQGGYDVYVFEGWFPAAPPSGHWLLIDPPAKSGALGVAGTLGRRTIGGQEANDAQIVRVLPSPLLRGVDLTGVGITEAKRVALPEWGEEVVTAREAPLIFMGYPDRYRAVVFSFDLRASNLFGRIGFPVLVANVVNWLTGEGAQSNSFGLPANDGRFMPGDALLVQPLPRTTRVQIETPAKKHYRLDGNQPVRFVDTLSPGAYTVIQYAGNQEITRRVYVATVLQPGREAALADLKPREGLQDLANVGGSQPAVVPLGPGRQRNDLEWWRALGVVALAGLFAEWWWFHR